LGAAVTLASDVQVPRQLVLFRVGQTHYAVDIEAVDEILPVLPITPLPGAPGGVLGLADVRKHVVPVFDLHWRFGVANAERSPESRLILVETAEGSVAMLVDAVEEVLTVSPDDYQQVEAPGSRAALGYLSGVIRREARLELWIDHHRVVPSGLHCAAIAA
jgi:purine-binding chemotaxis protein CheW